jgi:hypothetical protein
MVDSVTSRAPTDAGGPHGLRVGGATWVALPTPVARDDGFDLQSVRRLPSGQCRVGLQDGGAFARPHRMHNSLKLHLLKEALRPGMADAL